MPSERMLAALVLALIGFVGTGAYAHYVSQYPRTISSLRPGEKSLQVMTFNTSIINQNRPAISAEVQRLDPDFVALMEFSDTRIAILDQLHQHYPYTAACVPRRHCHFAVLSKVPIVDSEVKEGWNGPLMVRVTLGADFSGLEIVAVHFPRLPHVKAQFEQLAVLLDYLRERPNAIILMGDFNATKFSRLVSEFSEHTGMRRLTAIPSWPSFAELPQWGIDHIYADRRIRLLEKPRIGRASGSDHYPVVATIAVPAKMVGLK
jgi:endonuclease/exonuclease/phosphatase (EEP) superfamily protein YafD